MSKRRRFLEDSGEDPTTGIINLTDCMLVLAVGFLVFSIMALHGNPTLLSQTAGTVPNTVQVKTGNITNETPNSTSGSGNNYQQVGTVYKDPTTGKYILVS